MEYEIQYKILKADELNRELFVPFSRRQIVTDCWRKIDGKWQVKADPFIDDWSEEDYAFLVSCLQNTIQTGGYVLGAFWQGQLKGFVSVEGAFIGSRKEYLDLSSIHVSADMRGHGIGKALFSHAKEWARQKGAEKLYISAHSAVESQAFYKAMECVEAQEYNKEHVQREPYDCQLECVV